MKTPIVTELTAPQIVEDQPLSFSEIAQLADGIHKRLMHADSQIVIAGNENFSNMFRGIIVSIVNTIGHIANTFKTNIFKPFRTLKRSELRYYNESNIATMRELMKISYDQLLYIDVPYPEKMSQPYDDTAQEIHKFLSYLDMVAKLRAIQANLENIVQSLGDDDDTNILALRARIDFDVVETGKAFTKVEKCFKGTKTTATAEFRAVFKKTTSFRTTNQTLLEGEKHFLSVAKVDNTLGEMEKLMDDFLKAYNDGKIQVADKKIFENLATYCKEIALVCDMFGVAIQDFQRVEHNYVKVCDVLRKKINV